jgi:hypothetical protein
MTQFVGKYEFVSSENYDELLQACDVGMIDRTVQQKDKPILDISVSGEDFVIKTTSLLKTTQLAFTLGKVVEQEIWGRVVKTLVNKEGDNKLVQLIYFNSLECKRVMEFYSLGIKEIWTASGITSLRNYKRV